MKIAYDPSHYRDNTTIEEMIYNTAKLGYEYIELSPRKDFIWFYEYPKVDRAMIKKMKQNLKDTGLQISSVLPVQQWSSPIEEERQAAIKNWKRCIEITSELGVDLMNTEFSGYKDRPLESQDAFLRSMDELIPIFEKEGIALNIQPHPNDFIERNDETMRIIRAIDKDWLNLVFSTAHAFYNDDGLGDIDAIFDDAGDRLKHVLIADTLNHKAAYGLRYIINPPDANVTIHQHLNPGEGEVDFDTIFRRLREMKFDGIITNSVFTYPDRPEWSSQVTMDVIRKGLHLS
ncbi:hypothetical protein RV11_GL002794 [Enterococcus phoeniculicola]|jgi:myo-inositol catabolism protein IolH|uniref:Xylose isomerase-like TIM barrel domain-containing protein n=1 Tax=Enterococcus phoeniculicola ATCC BAA-412 TaxID=1158610 RepID=R3TJT3_9ENTE|nr:sugar phosphate isomerase/epimerase [Enterococcus phoeniculicola]EOL41684.1 hypothetical protein UC3_03249 [Enterococcus phoeniculicola ATCC BAA-412]EOT78822.1 hypothetical protein I589_00327 [Enterococcus phoeniculicola ATCC BAA-412]OJG72655.1 hypothetical protein RV11_GL002794 [Enterococcus phoeniculicola]